MTSVGSRPKGRVAYQVLLSNRDLPKEKAKQAEPEEIF